MNISNTDKNSEVLKTWSEVWNGVKDYIKKINDNKSKYDKNFMKTKFNSNDNIPLRRQLYFPTITLIIRRIFGR